MQIETVFDGLLADKLLRKNSYDCIILDINLPGKSGFDICRTFRTFNRDTPVLMLTAFDELDDKVQGFDSGADDYLTKPFYMRELLIRVNSLIRRNHQTTTRAEPSTLMSGDLVINLVAKKVVRQGKEIEVTPREFAILSMLLQHKGELVSKADMIREIWGSAFDTNTNTIEVYINFLRNKIDKPFGKSNIKTKIGFGYYFDEHGS